MPPLSSVARLAFAALLVGGCKDSTGSDGEPPPQIEAYTATFAGESALPVAVHFSGLGFPTYLLSARLDPDGSGRLSDTRVFETRDSRGNVIGAPQTVVEGADYTLHGDTLVIQRTYGTNTYADTGRVIDGLLALTVRNPYNVGTIGTGGDGAMTISYIRSGP